MQAHYDDTENNNDDDDENDNDNDDGHVVDSLLSAVTHIAS